MVSRRTYLKIVAGSGAFVLPWTVLPKLAGQTIQNFLGKPAVKIVLPSQYNILEKPSAEVLAKTALEDIQSLSDPGLEGRRAGTAGETRALVYLEEQCKALNLKAFGGTHYWQMFSIPAMEERIINGRALFRPDSQDNYVMPAANLLAGLPGKNQGETLILSAHYDHLGIYAQQLYPGANDNASGVGCVLQVMRRLTGEYHDGNRPKINIAAAFWGAEEMGYLGSKYFVKNPLIPLSEIRAVINLDTVAIGQEKDFILWEIGNSSLTGIIKKAVKKNEATIEADTGGGHHSDEVAFIGTGVPAVTMLSRQWLDRNHTPADDFSIINPEKLETAVGILYDAVQKIAY